LETLSLGRAFVIKTDHYSLKFLLDQCLSTIPQHQWASKLLGFNFQVEYKPGAHNVVADALSRCNMETATVVAISGPSLQLFDNMRWEIDNDPMFSALHIDAAVGNCGADWRVMDGLILVEDSIFLPAVLPTVPLALATTHGADHEGLTKTLHHLCTDFHVLGVHALVAEFVCTCETCQRNKTKQLHPAGLLQLLDIPSAVWADI
jgi:hypothetical protein